MVARRSASILLAIACLSLATLGRPHAQTRAADTIVAIRNATILTATRGTIQNGTIVLRGGKIAAVGANVAIPAGAEVVDGTGKFVSPGIIDCHSHIAADSINEGGTTVSSMTGIEDVLDPTDINIYRDLAGGDDDGQRAARQREPDRRQELRDQAALGQDARAEDLALRRRDARHQVRARREPEAPRRRRGRTRRHRAGAVSRRRAWASSS